MNSQIIDENTSTKILLWGGGSQARLASEMIRESKLGITKFIFDETLDGISFNSNALFFNDVTQIKRRIGEVSHYVVCIGSDYGFARFTTSQALSKIGLKPLNLIHKKSFIEPTASIGDGCQIMPFAIVHKFSIIGMQSIINTNATVDHECIIGNGVHIMGNAAIAGKVEIGDYASIGTNSTILPRVKIGEGSYVGAGSVVTKDVPPYTVVAGNPARIIKKNNLKVFEKSLIQLNE